MIADELILQYVGCHYGASKAAISNKDEEEIASYLLIFAEVNEN